jgi:hypothetical protein
MVVLSHFAVHDPPLAGIIPYRHYGRHSLWDRNRVRKEYRYQGSPASIHIPTTGLAVIIIICVAAGRAAAIIAQACGNWCIHLAWQVPLDCSESVVQELLSPQLVGHEPSPDVMPVSHNSPVSTTPLPQVGEQSLSLFELHPAAQQPSPLIHWVMVTFLHPEVESQESTVHLLLSSHEGAGPPTHFPSEHLSGVVQAFESSQEFVLLLWLHV